MGLSSSRDGGSNAAQTSYYDAADCLPQSKPPREKKTYSSWSGGSSDGDVEEKGEPVGERQTIQHTGDGAHFFVCTMQ